MHNGGNELMRKSVVTTDYMWQLLIGMSKWPKIWKHSPKRKVWSKLGHLRSTVRFYSGVHSFHVSMAYPDTCMLHDDELFQVFTKCRELGAIALVHAENGSLIKELEKEMSKLGITGPEGHLLSRPEKARTRRTTRIISEWFVLFSLKLKQLIEQLPLRNKLGKISAFGIFSSNEEWFYC